MLSKQILFSPPARGLIVAGAIALVITLAKAASPVLTPLLLAVFVAIVSTPALHWMRRKGVPKWGALGIIAFVLLDVGSLLALMATGAVEGFRESLPTYQERFTLLSQQFGGMMERIGVAGSTEAVPDLLDPNKVSALVRALLSSASGIFATGLMVLLAVIFILAEAPALPAKLRVAFGMGPEGEARLKRLLDAINGYMRIKTLTSAGTAVCVWLLLTVLGIDFAILWAILAFFFNFIPVVGNILMMIPAVLLALVQTDIPTTLLVAAGYLVINTVIGNIIEPKIMGKGLGISTLAVFIALLFWGWLFGTVGMFLAVPLTTALIIALDASPHTRPVAILLGPEIEEPPPGAVPSANVPGSAAARGAALPSAPANPEATPAPVADLAPETAPTPIPASAPAPKPAPKPARKAAAKPARKTTPRPATTAVAKPTKKSTPKSAAESTPTATPQAPEPTEPTPAGAQASPAPEVSSPAETPPPPASRRRRPRPPPA